VHSLRTLDGGTEGTRVRVMRFCRERRPGRAEDTVVLQGERERENVRNVAVVKGRLVGSQTGFGGRTQERGGGRV